MAGESFDYKFGNKNNWRRWQWNRIVERLAIPPRDAVVLYLAGQDDHDRIIARGHGFRDENMIAVEKDRIAFRKLKEKKILAVHGEFFDTLASWPPRRNVHVVIADICCGLESSVIENVKQWPLYPHFLRTVFAFNLMRGREKSGALERFMLQRIMAAGAKIWVGADAKHRGMAIYYIWLKSAWRQVNGFDAFDFASHEIKTIREVPTGLDIDQSVESFSKQTNAIFNSYKNPSDRIFDSIIWKNTVNPLFGKNPDAALKWFDSFRAVKKVRAKRATIAAIMAHRTMRKERIGIYA